MNKTQERKLMAERELARREAAEGPALAVERAKHAARVEDQQEGDQVKDTSKMSHETASGTLRRLEFRGEGSQEERLALALRALETSPSEWRHVWLKRVDIYANDRTAKVAVGEITALDGVPVELMDEVESAFSEEFGSTEGD